MDKNKLLQEIYRNRALMGLSEKNLSNLISEASIPPWTKLFTKLATVVDEPAAKKFIEAWKKENPSEATALDKFLKESGGYNFEGKLINSLDNLTGLGRFTAYKQLTNFITSNGDAFVTMLAKMDVESTLPKVLDDTNKFTMKDISERLSKVPSLDSSVKNYLNAFSSGDISGYSIKEMEAFIKKVREKVASYSDGPAKDIATKYCDDAEGMIKKIKNNADQLGVSTEKKIGETTQLTKTGEVASKIDDKPNFKQDASNQGAAETGNQGATRTGNQGNPTGGQQNAFDRAADDFEEAADDVVENISTGKQKFIDMYERSEAEFRAALGRLRQKAKKIRRGGRGGKKLSFSEEDFALTDAALKLEEMYPEKKLFKQNDDILAAIQGEILEAPSVREFITLQKEWRNYKKNIKRLDRKNFISFEKYLKQNGKKMPNGFKRFGVANVVKVLDGHAENFAIFLGTPSKAGGFLPWTKAGLSLLATASLVTGTITGSLYYLIAAGDRAISGFDPIEKERVIAALNNYFKYDKPILYINGKEFNIYEGGQNGTYKKNPPTPDFDAAGANVDEQTFYIKGGITIEGKTYYLFKINMDDSKFLAGSETFNQKHTLTAIDVENIKPKTELTQVEKLEKFQVWCEENGHKECVYNEDKKWEYNDKGSDVYKTLTEKEEEDIFK